MINVITFEREYGSGANVIAAKIADRLGWTLWDQQLTTAIATSLECDQAHIEQREERIDPLHYRLFKSFLRGSFEGSLNAPRMKLADAEGIRKCTEQIIRRIAKEGKCVIVGRGSGYYLHGAPDMLHIFVYAQFEEKVRRLQKQGKTEKEAVELVETVDQDRSAFIKEHFDIEWPARQYFHLMVNSGMGDDVAVETILSAMNILQNAH